MSTNKKVSRILGVAFLLQFISSVSSGSFIKPLWLDSGNISTTMRNIADNPWLINTNILFDMLTALGVIFLGSILFLTLRAQSEKIAIVALGFYILEAGLLATSRIATYSLLRLSQVYAGADQTEYMLTLGNLAIESMDFVGSTLHIVAFGVGAIMFYYLLYQSRLVPRGLSLWGLITVIPVLVGTLATFYDYQISFLFIVPYIPFEFVIGVWILIKGIPETAQATRSRTQRTLSGEGVVSQ
jgi:hypothetical protein